MSTSSVKLVKAAIDIFSKPGGGETIVIRGVIDPTTLESIQVGGYQREILPTAKISSLMKALKTSTVPDVELGMRGDKHQVREGENGGEAYYLQDPTFVIDGLQRITAAKRLMEAEPGVLPRIGALVHLDTTEEWEKERFRILNQERTRLNVNILLRNARDKSEATDMLFRLCQDPTFALCNRIQWAQRMARTELMPALVLCQTIGILHARFARGTRGYSPQEVTSALDSIQTTVGRNILRDNIKTFFEILDECFGIRRVVYQHAAIHLRRTFLVTVADIFTRHNNFWNGYRLSVERRLREKLAKFPTSDPEISRLAGSGGKAKDILYQLIIEHINSGKRTRRLTPADGLTPKSMDTELEVTGNIEV